MSEDKNKPNIFKYATKELSQDAVICWLIEWSSYDGQQRVWGSGRTMHVYSTPLEHSAPYCQVNGSDQYYSIKFTEQTMEGEQHVRR